MEIPKDITRFAEKFSKSLVFYKSGTILNSDHEDLTVEFPVCEDEDKYRKIAFSSKWNITRVDFFLEGWNMLYKQKLLTADVIYFFVIWAWIGISTDKIDFAFQDKAAVEHCKKQGKDLRAIWIAFNMLLADSVTSKARLVNFQIALKA